MPVLTVAAAIFLACPLKWGGNGDAYNEANSNSDSGAEAVDGPAAYYKKIGYGCEDVNCISQGAYPWWPVLRAAMFIARGLEVLQLYFSRLIEHLGGANGSVSVGSLQAADAAPFPWFVLQHCIQNVCSAINQASEVVSLPKKKVRNSAVSETTHNIHPAQGYHSCGERTVVVEKHADGKCDIFSGRQSMSPPCDYPYRRALEGGVAKTECSSAVQFNPERPKLFDSTAQYNQTDAINRTCGWLTASYRALASLFRTMGSVLLRLLYVVPLGLTAAAAGFWLLGLTHISACLRAMGLGGCWLLQWESTVRRELEEVIFTAVTAAASAAGPTYVKFLQWIATRPDLFHESLCSRCARLQTSVNPFSFPRAALLLREQFGDDVARHLLLDPTPIGCGCIAQVYRAYLLLSNEASEESKRTFLDHAFVLGGSLSKSAAAEYGNGNKLPPVAVAVKIMRPGVREAMEFDLRMMLLVASVLEYLPTFGFVALRKSVEEFGVAMRRQLDFGLEEEHLKRFRSNFGLSTIPIPGDLLPLRNRCRRPSDPKQCGTQEAESKAEHHHTNIVGSLSRKILGMRCQVTFPYPFEALSSSEVIVMTLEPGFTLNQLFRARAELQELEGSSRYQRGCRGNRGLAMTRREQGDSLLAFPSPAAQRMIELIFPVLPTTLPTPLRTRVPQLDGPLELVVLDCGLAGSLDQADRVNFVTLLEAIARKRGREAALAMLERAKRSSCQDKEGFCSEVEHLIVKHHFEEGNSLQMSHVRLTSLMGHMLSVSKKYCVELDPSFVSIVVAMSVLEGVGAQLCPDADVLRTALPYSLMAAKLVNPESSRES
ncbi:Probable ubiquinone biosynthesis protein ubiB, related [Eimeria brunetti]|uniref:Probable ubiquinone biosynthesis protein ubiB, related n=1 Tax=Eimeria brunetti TaxID=51314 RepID=U6LVA1_9EIME|nr:Probable ubiquinone biosynthesis protein ubiB, related [Eimeria brunetti]